MKERTKTMIKTVGVLAGAALGVVASIGAESVTGIGLRQIPLSGASKLTKLLAPIGIIGMGAAAGTLAGQGMEKKCEKTAERIVWIGERLEKRNKMDEKIVEGVFGEEIELKKLYDLENEMKEHIAEIANAMMQEEDEEEKADLQLVLDLETKSLELLKKRIKKTEEQQAEDNVKE